MGPNRSEQQKAGCGLLLRNVRTLFIYHNKRWCTPCTVLVPTLEEKIVNKKGSLEYAKVNIDEQRLLAIKNKVKTVPSILVFKDGKQAERKAGIPTDEELDNILLRAEAPLV